MKRTADRTTLLETPLFDYKNICAEEAGERVCRVLGPVQIRGGIRGTAQVKYSVLPGPDITRISSLFDLNSPE